MKVEDTQVTSTGKDYGANNNNYATSHNTGLNLLGTMTRVEVPYVKVTFGEGDNAYTFGVYDKITGTAEQAGVAYNTQSVRYPNFVKSLQVTKINGQFNQYELQLEYNITDRNDPNFFEKVFSATGVSGKMTFSYGDLSMPSFIYRDEEALLLSVTSSFSSRKTSITYTVNAISSGTLLTAGTHSFKARYNTRPSTVLFEVLQDKELGVQELFYGMRNIDLVRTNGLIATDDKAITIEAKQNVSVFEYITYLVSSMTPTSDTKDSLQKSGVYVLNVVDDVSGIYGGPYFTVKKLNTAAKEANAIETYTIDIGYPSQNIVTDFTVNDNETYSVYYNYSNKIAQEQYNYRLNDEGVMEPVYAPLLSSGNPEFKTTESDRTWWTSVTQFPITASITLKGLLRPSLLMSYVRLNMYYFGRKHISSGLYAISKQVDTIDEMGFKTTLTLVRIGPDNDENAITSLVTTEYGTGASSGSSGITLSNGITVPNTGIK